MAYKDPKDPRSLESKRKHYRANKAKYIQKVKDTRGRNKKWIRDRKNVPCAECGNSYPTQCMDFDHVTGNKRSELSTMAHHGASLATLEEEASKCDIVCANCHRIRTHSRR